MLLSPLYGMPSAAPVRSTPGRGMLKPPGACRSPLPASCRSLLHAARRRPIPAQSIGQSPPRSPSRRGYESRRTQPPSTRASERPRSTLQSPLARRLASPHWRARIRFQSSRSSRTLSAGPMVGGRSATVRYRGVSFVGRAPRLGTWNTTSRRATWAARDGGRSGRSFSTHARYLRQRHS